MRKLFTTKVGLIALTVTATLVVAGAAVAYFTTTGSGTVSAGVGTNSVLTLNGTSASTLYPGTTSTVTFTANNPSPGHQWINTIHLASIKACPTGDTWNGTACTNSGTEITTCESVETGASDTNTANFWMPDVTVNQQVPSGTNQSITATGTLEMNDLASSQNACENANLTLNFTSS